MSSFLLCFDFGSHPPFPLVLAIQDEEHRARRRKTGQYNPNQSVDTMDGPNDGATDITDKDRTPSETYEMKAPFDWEKEYTGKTKKIDL